MDYAVLAHSSSNHTQSKTTAITIDDAPNACGCTAQLTASFVIAPSIVPTTIL